jgi:hypothetical protein
LKSSAIDELGCQDQGLPEGGGRDDEPGRDGEAGAGQAGQAGAFAARDGRVDRLPARQGQYEGRQLNPFLNPLLTA